MNLVTVAVEHRAFSMTINVSIFKLIIELIILINFSDGEAVVVARDASQHAPLQPRVRRGRGHSRHRMGHRGESCILLFEWYCRIMLDG